MEPAKFAAFGGKQKYQRIECAKVQDMGFPEDELQSEGETAGLLITQNIHGTEGMEEMCKEKKGFQKQRFAWKQSPLRASDKMELLIHKLDNTSFTLQVTKKATVLDLKKAIQEKFERCGYQVSWPHVWGNFCLSFKHQKLLDNNSVSLRNLGIADRDELYFVRHLSTSSQPPIRGLFKIMRRISSG